MLLEITWFTDRYGRLAARWRDGLERWINDGQGVPNSQGIDADKIGGREGRVACYWSEVLESELDTATSSKKNVRLTENHYRGRIIST